MASAGELVLDTAMMQILPSRLQGATPMRLSIRTITQGTQQASHHLQKDNTPEGNASTSREHHGEQQQAHGVSRWGRTSDIQGSVLGSLVIQTCLLQYQCNGI